MDPLSPPPLPEIPGVRHTYVKINNRQIHIALAGQGKVLLLLHGWPQHWYAWRKIIPLLSKRYQLIMPDMRGFGWSDAPKNESYNKETLASDVLAIVDVLKLNQVGLV